MTKPIAVIVGATGGQGGSVVKSFLADGTYSIRGLTRNTKSPKAQELQAQGVEVVTGDLNDQASLIEAFKVQNSNLNPFRYKADGGNRGRLWYSL